MTDHIVADVIGDPVDVAAASPSKLGMGPMLLTVKDVEAALQLGRTLTYELVRTGVLPAVRIGRTVRIPREALVQWIAERSTRPVPSSAR